VALGGALLALALPWFGRIARRNASNDTGTVHVEGVP